MVEINVNGEPRSVEEGLSLSEFLRTLDLRPELVVVEHNGEIVRRDRYSDVRVGGGDSLELVHFVGGG